MSSNNTHKSLTITYWNNLRDVNGTRMHLTWEDFAAKLESVGRFKGSAKHSGISFAEFRQNRRALDHVERAHALVFDYDGKGTNQEQLQDVHQRFEGLQHIIHTTKSHKEDSPSFRIIFPLTRSVDRREFERLWRAVSARAGSVDTSTCDASRFWYTPCSNDDDDFEYIVNSDAPALDVEAWLQTKQAAQQVEVIERSDTSAKHSLLGRLFYRFKMVRGELPGDKLAVECPWADEHSAEPKRVGMDTSSIVFPPQAGSHVGWFKCSHNSCHEAGRMGTKDVLQWFHEQDPLVFEELSKEFDDKREGLGLATSSVSAEDAEPTPKQDENFVLHDVCDLLARPPVQRSWVVEDLCITAGRPTIISGYAGSGKTMFAQYLMSCVATGQPLFGSMPVSQGRVIHLDFEQGEDESVERYRAVFRGLGVQPHPDTFFYCADPPKYGPGVKRLLTERTAGATLCLLDPLRVFGSGLNENDSSFREVLDLLRDVSVANGCAFVLLHHATKPQPDQPSRTRGSSAIHDGSQCVMSYTADSEQNGVSNLLIEKQNVGTKNDNVWQLKWMGGQHHNDGVNYELTVTSAAHLDARHEDDLVRGLQSRAAEAEARHTIDELIRDVLATEHETLSAAQLALCERLGMPEKERLRARREFDLRRADGFYDCSYVVRLQWLGENGEWVHLPLGEKAPNRVRQRYTIEPR